MWYFGGPASPAEWCLLLGSVQAILGGDITCLLGAAASLVTLLLEGGLEVPWSLLWSEGLGA